MKDNS